MSYLALSASFEYLCYGSTAIINILILTARGSTFVCRRQILTTKVDPRAVRVNSKFILEANLMLMSTMTTID